MTYPLEIVDLVLQTGNLLFVQRVLLEGDLLGLLQTLVLLHHLLQVRLRRRQLQRQHLADLTVKQTCDVTKNCVLFIKTS